jgi:hypothetical protein
LPNEYEGWPKIESMMQHEFLIMTGVKDSYGLGCLAPGA